MTCQQCGKSNSITINQKRYCANCGQPLSTGQAKPKADTGTPTPAEVLDLSKHKTKPSKSKPTGVKHGHSAHSVHGVHRPQPAAKPKLQSAPVKHQHHSQRAKAVTKSQRISKFHNDPSEIEQPANPTDMSPHHSYSASAPKQRQLADHITRQRQSAQPAAVFEQVKPKSSKPKRHGPLKRVRKQLRAKPRLATVSALAVAALVFGAYITYLNYPNIKFRVAASRAGLEAQAPRYTPSGYDLDGHVSYGPGRLTVRFSSNADNNFIDLTQAKTDWDSQSLYENYIKSRTDKAPVTFQQNGLTIYMYGSNDAAWVNSGILYTIEGNSKLSPEQILKIASSL